MPTPEDDLCETPTASQDEGAAARKVSSMTREEAIEAGYLIDVTPIAESVGLNLPVAMSRLLWEVAITASRSVDEDDCDPRVRHVLMALRLHLAIMRVANPVLEFVALLDFPPESVPELCAFRAIVHEEGNSEAAMILLLPDEVMIGLAPSSN